eukprot:TRINITY_DN112680_c0_g1_i1.p1 TRINITY_DN112680_c0_g1~~TRINITY_DN112680_c0_g1_i1.p1  ORF type:complete len:367 (-),score=65.39 TRINITY_DN112680_c0_g1_i1:142-1176(-)
MAAAGYSGAELETSKGMDGFEKPSGGVQQMGKQPSYISPWIDASPDEHGDWQLPLYPCEIKGLADDDPRNVPWRPGEYTLGVDNIEQVNAATSGPDGKLQTRLEQIEWAGSRALWRDEFDSAELQKARDRSPESLKRLLAVPHMPGQPLKEKFARQKALDPRPFEDRHFEHIVRELPPEWPRLLRDILWVEGFGVHSEDAPAEWTGQELDLVPAAYVTPRCDTVTICVGNADEDAAACLPTPGCEYDCLEFLYAKDQNGRLITVQPFASCGIMQHRFSTYSFVPPEGTSSITPFACFKLRGAWRGAHIDWDPKVGNPDMEWFAVMSQEEWRRAAGLDKSPERVS